MRVFLTGTGSSSSRTIHGVFIGTGATNRHQKGPDSNDALFNDVEIIPGLFIARGCCQLSSNSEATLTFNPRAMALIS